MPELLGLASDVSTKPFTGIDEIPEFHSIQYSALFVGSYNYYIIQDNEGTRCFQLMEENLEKITRDNQELLNSDRGFSFSYLVQSAMDETEAQQKVQQILEKFYNNTEKKLEELEKLEDQLHNKRYKAYMTNRQADNYRNNIEQEIYNLRHQISEKELLPLNYNGHNELKEIEKLEKELIMKKQELGRLNTYIDTNYTNLKEAEKQYNELEDEYNLYLKLKESLEIVIKRRQPKEETRADLPVDADDNERELEVIRKELFTPVKFSEEKQVNYAQDLPGTRTSLNSLGSEGLPKDRDSLLGGISVSHFSLDDDSVIDDLDSDLLKEDAKKNYTLPKGAELKEHIGDSFSAEAVVNDDSRGNLEENSEEDLKEDLAEVASQATNVAYTAEIRVIEEQHKEEEHKEEKDKEEQQQDEETLPVEDMTGETSGARISTMTAENEEVESKKDQTDIQDQTKLQIIIEESLNNNSLESSRDEKQDKEQVYPKPDSEDSFSLFSQRKKQINLSEADTTENKLTLHQKLAELEECDNDSFSAEAVVNDDSGEILEAKPEEDLKEDLAEVASQATNVAYTAEIRVIEEQYKKEEHKEEKDKEEQQQDEKTLPVEDMTGEIAGAIISTMTAENEEVESKKDQTDIQDQIELQIIIEESLNNNSLESSKDEKQDEDQVYPKPDSEDSFSSASPCEEQINYFEHLAAAATISTPLMGNSLENNSDSLSSSGIIEELAADREDYPINYPVVNPVVYQEEAELSEHDRNNFRAEAVANEDSGEILEAKSEEDLKENLAEIVPPATNPINTEENRVIRVESRVAGKNFLLTIPASYNLPTTTTRETVILSGSNIEIDNSDSDGTEAITTTAPPTTTKESLPLTSVSYPDSATTSYKYNSIFNSGFNSSFISLISDDASSNDSGTFKALQSVAYSSSNPYLQNSTFITQIAASLLNEEKSGRLITNLNNVSIGLNDTGENSEGKSTKSINEQIDYISSRLQKILFTFFRRKNFNNDTEEW